MPQINPSIPIIGQSDSTEDPKIVTALTQLVSAVNTVDSAQVSPTAGITDGQLASPTSPVWRTILQAAGTATSSLVFGTNYYLAANNAPIASGAAASTAPSAWLPTAADVAVAGKTTRLRLSVMAFVNATAPGVNLAWGLYPVTAIAGAAGAIQFTLGAVVATATLNAPLAGTGGHVASASFDLSSLSPTTTYVPGIAVSATPAASSLVAFQYFLEMRHT